jgi:hypothetical protein
VDRLAVRLRLRLVLARLMWRGPLSDLCLSNPTFPSLSTLAASTAGLPFSGFRPVRILERLIDRPMPQAEVDPSAGRALSAVRLPEVAGKSLDQPSFKAIARLQEDLRIQADYCESG